MRAVHDGGSAKRPKRFAPEPTSRRRFVILPLVMLSITLPNVLRNWDGVRDAWTTSWPMIADMLLVVAGGVLVAAVAFGLTAWRGARA
jgi:uncharacterized membrane protein SirB2